MKIKSLNDKLSEYLKVHNLQKRFNKQVLIFEANPHPPSLKLEILEPKHLHIYSFRLDRKYRIIFIITNHEAEIIAITNHYPKLFIKAYSQGLPVRSFRPSLSGYAHK